MKKSLKALFTDNEWDLDLSKVIGFVCMVAGLVGYFKQLNGFEWIIGTGIGLLGLSKAVDGK